MSDKAFVEMLSGEGELDLKTVRAMKSLLQESYSEMLDKIRLVGDNDSKYNTFRQLVENVKRASGDNRRIIVFSYYTETLKYLRRRLTSDGYRVALMYGKTPYDTPMQQKDEDGFEIIGRNDIMKDFEDGKYEILLLSEVGGEGLDFQFCSSLINYDLPYNPMRIEQRIGRIDRMGQKADKIIIGNLCIENTIDVVINRVLLSRISDAADLIGELEPIIAQNLAEINELIISSDLTADEISQREQEIEQQIEKARQVRVEFEEARYELVNDRGFRDEFEDSIRNSRISPYESLLFTYSFPKKENGCWCKIISESAADIHVTKDICDRLRAYIKRFNLGKAGEELKQLIASNGDLRIDFDGDSAYASEGRTFFKPAGAWIHFIIDYIRALESDEPENVFYAYAKKDAMRSLKAGRYWAFVYEMEFRGFFETKTFEYILVSENGEEVVCLTDEERKQLFRSVKNSKVPADINLNMFDDIRMQAEDAAEIRKEEFSSQAMGKNGVKIGSRIQAIQNLSELRVQKMEDDLIGARGKEEEKLRKSIEREKRKTADKVSVLEDKLKFMGTYALDAVCLIDVS
ncbi:MAG: hypothetical protein LUE92_16755 [Clostridiales bacterium]|nr:hypothetical protein [Clostridiales bacterium]